MAEAPDIRRVVIVSSAAIALRGAVLFPGSTTIYANGELPIDPKAYNDAVVAGADQARRDTFCPAFVAVQCPRVRYIAREITAETTRADIEAWFAAGEFKDYTSSAPPQLAAKPPAEPPPVVAPDAAGAEPVAEQRARLQAESEKAAAEGDFGTAYGLANWASATVSLQPAHEPPQEPQEPPPVDLPPLEAYADQASVKHAPKQRKRPRLAAVDGNLARAPEPEQEPLPANLSEGAIADYFVSSRGKNWRYATEINTWLEWRGDGWHRDALNAVTHACRGATSEALLWDEGKALSVEGKRKMSSRNMSWNVRSIAATHPDISILVSELDANPMLLGVPGGCVDLSTGKSLEADPKDYITRRTSVAPEAGEHPLFDRVLSRACAEHDGMREYLLRWFGYMLTGDVREEAFMFLYGPGGSGKSTLIKCLTEIAGDYAVSISMEALMEAKNPRHTQEIAKLAGMRLIYASETSEGRMWNEALIKDLTGRDAVTARFMRGNDFTFKPCGKLLLYGNAMPRLKSVGEEIRRRIHLIEYAGSLAPEDRDNTLKDRLVSEYPAILHTLIRGCVDFLDCAGLGKPESVTASVDSYLEGEDSFALFIDDCVDRDAQARALSSEVYRRYSTWARNAGEYVMSQKRFVQTLRLRGFDTLRTAQGRSISGLRLRAAPAQDERPHWHQDD